MKNSSIILALIIAFLASACKKDPMPPGIAVTPSSFLQFIDLGDVIEFTIEGKSGDANLRSLTITSKPEGGVTSTIWEEELFGKNSTSVFIFEDVSIEPPADRLMVFTITDEDGLNSQTVRRVILNNDPALVESTGHNLYSNYASSNPNGFNISD